MKINRLLALLCFVLSLAAAVPLFFGCASEGALASLLFAVLGILLFSPRWLDKLTKKCRWLKTVLLICCIFAVTVCIIVSAIMTLEISKKPDESAGTVIVLGCQVKDGKPSEMLKRRLDTAIEYLEIHPECAVIVTGAKGRGEDSAEADVMYTYLLSGGIEADRIYKENQAKSTSENLRYSARIIERESLDTDVIIVSDAFHQYRAGRFAREHGLTPSPLSSSTPFFVFITYWFREILAVLRMYIFNS